MGKNIMSISIDENQTVEIRFEGNPTVSMLGALDIGKSWIMNNLKNTKLFSESTSKTEEEIQERKVSKSEAISVYLDARSKIEQRLQSIANCDESQNFSINEDLLSKL